MTAWCVVVDVWFMDPQTIAPGEDAVAFAERVQKMIAKRAGLEAVHWDGYLKYWKPSERFIQVMSREAVRVVWRFMLCASNVPCVSFTGPSRNGRKSVVG
jgi:hypothetical protein